MSPSVALFLHVLALAVALIGLTGCAVSSRTRAPDGFHPSDERSFQDYTVRVYQGDESKAGFLEILRRGRRVYSTAGWRFGIDRLPYAHTTDALAGMGRSITSDGLPNLVVAEWTGGAHCCFVFRIFEIGKRFRLVDTINARHSEQTTFRDLRGDGTLEVVMNDWTFAYWNTSFADSPAPQVILRYRAPKYVPDLELMRKPAPTAAELVAQADALRSEFKPEDDFNGNKRWKVPPALCGAMLDLIYTGNLESARQLCDRAWPDTWPGKREFLREFREQLATSPYYQDLLRLNPSGMRPLL